MEAWDEPRTRLCASVFVREGASGPMDGGGEGLVGAVGEVQRRFGQVLRRWMQEGLDEANFPAEQLVWEFFATIAYVRSLYLNGRASEERRRAGRDEPERLVGVGAD